MKTEYKRFYELKKLNTSKKYCYTIKCYLEKLPSISEIDSDWCLSFISSIANPHTRRTYSRFLKMVLSEFHKEHLMDGIKIKSLSSSVSASELITDEEYHKLLVACETNRHCTSSNLIHPSLLKFN